jgi:MFS family permease
MHGMWHIHPAKRGLRIAGIAVLAVIGTALFALAFGWLVMLLWNWLMPAIFNIGVITYWQAFGIVILAKLLFGAIAGPRGGPHRNPWGGNPFERGRGPRHGRDDWRWYREFWEQEGRPAFERFVEKKRTEAAAGSEPPQEA